jgi:hypothetical protein
MDDPGLDVGRQRDVTPDGRCPVVVCLDQTVERVAGFDASLVGRIFCGNPVAPSPDPAVMITFSVGL